MEYPIVTGDLVVGGPSPDKAVYSAEGRKLTAQTSSVQGDRAVLDELQKTMARNAAGGGGQPLITPATTLPKQGKRTKKQHKPPGAAAGSFEAFVSLPRELEPVEKETVTFENDFGKIKMKVLSVIEHDLAFALLFENEDDIVFEPKVSESLAFYDQNRRSFQVYYPGVLFDMPNSLEKLMILFKIEE